ncbi:hypothetical protein H9W90_00700 [Polaribacter pectinis]|uniref:Lipoprotein n=1 Tax=Polaribacter pectinis TaxID=2738844 RepID=A0A7G9LAM7_9FLAO|nr:hypothetical protein [Polaribacter pectinis]QNM85676.1 hypothetical protein H9W90_00700 [Polaribacter pectinis]
MKTFNLFALVASITLVFSSCSTNENLLPEEQSVDLLKSYSIKRDANGAYSLDYNLNGNAKTEKVVDNNINQFYLYSSDSQTSRRATQDLVIDGTELKVGFVDTSSDKLPQITITDDNLALAKNSNKKLKEYSITSNQDGTYNLDFSVNNKVRVDFVYNEEINTYEIHLEEGKSNETSFSRVLEKADGQPLKFDFVNHLDNTEAKGLLSLIRKPQGVIL